MSFPLRHFKIILATRPVERLLLDDHWRSESALHAFGERWMSSAPSPLRGESGRLAASFGRVPIGHPPLPRPADLPAAGAQAGPAPRPDPNTGARAPASRR